MHPFLVKNFIFPFQEFVMGRPTYSAWKQMEEIQWYSPNELRELQIRKLRALLCHAASKIPYYSNIFRRIGFNPQKVNNLEDLKKISFLSKQDIKRCLDLMICQTVPGGPIRYNTGGSTGEPLIFYFDRKRQGYDMAARIRAHRWWGVDIGDRELYIWGSPVELSRQDRLKNLRDRLINNLLVSAFDISPDILPSYVNKILNFKPKCIFGYPSSISLLCELGEKAHIKLSNLGIEVIFCTAEILYDYQRKIISEAFGGIPVIDGYGSREGGFISHECPEGSMHITSDSIIVEFIKDGEPVNPGEEGEIVITHLDNYAMPFIRYRTGDIGRPSNLPCKCGRCLETMEVCLGRSTDFIVTEDGRIMHALSLIYIIRDITGVQKFKIIQEEINKIRILIVHDDNFSYDVNEIIVEQVKKRMGRTTKVYLEMVDDIPFESSGKYRYVESRVNTF